MFCSASVWPTQKHAFVPIIMNVCPFEKMERFGAKRQSMVEKCSYCAKLIDRTWTSMCCPWCQRTTRVKNVKTAAAQREMTRIVIAGDEKPNFTYTLLFVLDAGSTDVSKLIEYLLLALSGLPNGYSYQIVVIFETCMTWVLVNNEAVVLLDVHNGSNVSDFFDPVREMNDKKNIGLIGQYLRTIRKVQQSGNSVDAVIASLRGNKSAYFRIVLFASRGPSKPDNAGFLIDWITMERANAVVNGFVIAGDDVSESHIFDLVGEIASMDPVFDVHIDMDVPGYNLVNKTFRCAAGIPYMSTSFVLKPKMLSVGGMCLCGVSVKYTRFSSGVAYEEEIWMSKIFIVTPDFIPLCSGLHPKVLIPYLHREGTLDAFVKALVSTYMRECSGSLAGRCTDNTFAGMPNCLSFLSTLFEKREAKDAKNVPCDRETAFRRLCPRLSYWESGDKCIVADCPRDLSIYKSIETPNIVVFDRGHEIVVFLVYNQDEIGKHPDIERLVDSMRRSRFPQPYVRYQAIQALLYSDVFPLAAEFRAFVNVSLAVKPD